MLDKDVELIKKAKDIFIADDIDEDILKENIDEVNQWETNLIQGNAFLEWQGHDVTKQISAQAKEAYRDASNQLAFNRLMNEGHKNKLYSIQDACSFILSLTEVDVKSSLESLREDIKKRIQSFN